MGIGHTCLVQTQMILGSSPRAATNSSHTIRIFEGYPSRSLMPRANGLLALTEQRLIKHLNQCIPAIAVAMAVVVQLDKSL